jgi:pimeloyl-ACP methyl ester carboxylesterase
LRCSAGAERPVLVGASLGGLTALVAEGERGPLARALVLVDLVPRLEMPGVERIREFMHTTSGGFDSLAARRPSGRTTRAGASRFDRQTAWRRTCDRVQTVGGSGIRIRPCSE